MNGVVFNTIGLDMTIMPEDLYAEKYVAFIDIVGFKTVVKMGDCDPAQRERLRGAISELRKTMCEIPRLDVVVSQFSDCVVISAKKDKEGLCALLEAVILLSRNLLSHEFLVRGGLAVGGLHHEAGTVYGLGMISAYELETDKGGFPRTIISEDVAQDITAYGLQKYVAIDPKDERIFVHFLLHFELYRPTPIYAGKEILEPFGKWITNFVLKSCRKLSPTDARTRAKYEWLMEYWNCKVATSGVFKRMDIDMPLFPEEECGQSLLHNIRIRG